MSLEIRITHPYKFRDRRLNLLANKQPRLHVMGLAARPDKPDCTACCCSKSYRSVCITCL